MNAAPVAMRGESTCLHACSQIIHRHKLDTFSSAFIAGPLVNKLRRLIACRVVGY